MVDVSRGASRSTSRPSRRHVVTPATGRVPVPAEPVEPDERQLLRRAQDISRVGSWLFEPAADQLWLSAVAAGFLGLPVPETGGHVAVAYQEFVGRIADEHRAALRAAFADLAETGGERRTRFAIADQAGTLRWFDARIHGERGADDVVHELVGTLADVSDIVETESQLRRAYEELAQSAGHTQAVISAVPDAIHIADLATGALDRATTSGRPLVGFTEQMTDVLNGRRLDELVPDDDRRELRRVFHAAAHVPDLAVAQLKHRVRHGEDGTRWLSRRITPFARAADGTVTHLLVVSRDVTELVAVEQRLAHAALHDELTGLPNRRIVDDRLEQSLRRVERGGHVAVLVCDLDGFKRCNDAYGHGVGDRVLVESARRMTAALRSADTIARMGGDEFAIILDVHQDEDPVLVAEQIAERIATAVARPVVVDGHERSIAVSIGIAVTDDGATAESLLSDADAAMYHVKSHGGNGHAFFDPAQRSDAAAFDRIERAIRHALAGEQVDVHYQPIVDPRTDAVHSVEALLRLRDADGAFLNTAQVVAVAERAGLIAALDERVLRLACRQVAAWRRQPDLAHLTLKVNRSVHDISRPGFYDRIDAALLDSGLDPGALTLEITETVLLDATPANLAELRALERRGVGLAIDDFGTGYASLRYLAELPISCIKIDRSFTADLPHDATSSALVRATIGLAEQLGLSCIVEGVETSEQLAALAPFPELLVQGYFYARPAPSDQSPPARIARSA